MGLVEVLRLALAGVHLINVDGPSRGVRARNAALIVYSAVAAVAIGAGWKWRRPLLSVLDVCIHTWQIAFALCALQSEFMAKSSHALLKELSLANASQLQAASADLAVLIALVALSALAAVASVYQLPSYMPPQPFSKTRRVSATSGASESAHSLTAGTTNPNQPLS